jgi:hypothetical protein
VLLIGSSVTQNQPPAVQKTEAPATATQNQRPAAQKTETLAAAAAASATPTPTQTPAVATQNPPLGSQPAWQNGTCTHKRGLLSEIALLS